MIETSVIRLLADDGEVRRLDEIEADVVRYALARYGGNLTEIARRLGIGRSTLYRRLQELNLRSRPTVLTPVP